jgi:hypothetical protein
MAPFLCGCTALNFMLGSEMDKLNAVEKNISIEELHTIPLDQVIQVTYTSGDSVVGKNGGIVCASDNHLFAAYFSSIRSKLDPAVAMPSLGDMVVIEFVGGFSVEREFAGLDREALAVRYHTQSKAFRVPLENVKAIMHMCGRRYEINRWAEVMRTESPQPAFDLIIKANGKDKRIPLQDIKYVTFSQTVPAFQTIGVTLGLVTDICATFIVFMCIEWSKYGMF